MININNLIILLAIVSLIFLYCKSNFEWLLILSGVYYSCLPIIQLADNKINSAYIITLFFIIIFIFDIFKQKKILLNRIQKAYLSTNIAILVVYFIAWVTNGNLYLSIIIPFIGIGQAFIAVLGMSYQYQLHNKNIRLVNILLKTILITSVIHIIFSFIELFNFELGKYLIMNLYSSESRMTVESLLYGFTRAFGASYTPVDVGVYILVSISFIIGYFVPKKNNEWNKYALAYLSSFVGLLLFSKVVIIGIPIIMMLTFLFMLIFYKSIIKELFRTYFKYVIIISISYITVISFANNIGLSSMVNYYFVENSNPIVALSSRYNNILTETSSDNVLPDGILVSSFQVFMEHPIIGVGPMAVRNEFLGDSEIIGVLHNGGIIAFLIYAVFYSGLFIYLIINKDLTRILILIAIGMSCVAASTFTISGVFPFLAYCLIDSKKEEIV